MSVVQGSYRALHSNRCEAWSSFHLSCSLLQMIATDLRVRKLTSYKRAEAGQSLRYSLLRLVNSLGHHGQSQRRVCVLYAWHPDPTRETVMQHLCAACQVRVEAFLPQCPTHSFPTQLLTLTVYWLLITWAVSLHSDFAGSLGAADYTEVSWFSHFCD